MESLLNRIAQLFAPQEDLPEPEEHEVTPFMTMLAGFMNDRRYLNYGRVERPSEEGAD